MLTIQLEEMNKNYHRKKGKSKAALTKSSHTIQISFKMTKQNYTSKSQEDIKINKQLVAKKTKYIWIS